MLKPSDGDRWLFYCWRCNQWCQQEGPWCLLYRAESFTSPCYFDEYPERARGVRWPDEMPTPPANRPPYPD